MADNKNPRFNEATQNRSPNMSNDRSSYVNVDDTSRDYDIADDG